jgi:alcohol dehydrogenase YqhD (iron-dependent ADH family)
MAAAAWRLYAKAKEYIGDGTITLGTGGFKMALFRGSSNASTVTLSTLVQISVQVSGGAYVAGGKYLAPSAGTWTLAGSTVTFDYTTLGITFTASGSAISAVQYAVIHNSAGKLLCWSKLSASAFSVADPNTLTVLPAATGVFTLT